MEFKKSYWVAIVGVGLLGAGVIWAAVGVKRAAVRAQTAFTEVGPKPSRDGHVAAPKAPLRAARSEAGPGRSPSPSVEEGEQDTLVSAAVDEMGLPESISHNYDAAFVYTGERNTNPLSDAYPEAPGAPAGVTKEEHMVVKEELLLEHFPHLRDKVEENRVERRLSSESFQKRGNKNPHDWALSKAAERGE
jgi:hypothetical protein